MSGDTVETMALFADVHDLNFTLLADPEGEIAAAFGVPTGPGGAIDYEGQAIERGCTAQRWTFVIGPDGTIIHRKPSVNAAGDAESVLDVIREAQGE